MKNFFNGFFALGLVVGSGVFILAYNYLIAPCPADNSTLWFCDEPQDIVLRVLEVIETIVAAAVWPAAIILLAIYLRQEINSLLSRISKVGRGHVEFSSEKQADLTGSVQETHLNFTVLDPLRNTAAAEVERGFRADLEAYDPEQKIPVLLRALTFQRMDTSYALAYANIFGSQIRTLDSLNEKRISRNEAEIQFKEFQKTDPNFADWTLDLYINYLLSWKFVDYSDDQYSITTNGRDFLLFLTKNGLSKDRQN